MENTNLLTITNIINSPPKLILAPMVRICTLPFRLLSLRNGADLVFTEEIIAKKLRFSEKVYNSDLNTNDYISRKDGSLVIRTHPEEKGKLILQIGVSNPEDAVEAVKVLADDIVGVDVNMGCPKHFSTHGNMGSALLHRPDLAKEKSGLPVSCKIRLLEDKEKTKSFIEVVQNTGIKFFTIHLRKKDQQSNIKANWKALLDIKEYAKIPFNSNGDILSPLDIYKLNKLKICHGFMLARGAIHNPKIFTEFKNFSLDDYIINTGIKLEDDFENLEDFINNEYEEINDTKNVTTSVKIGYDDDIKVSNKLSKIFDKKYNKQIVDILPQIREFIEICMITGNNFNNSKYICLYILKTHKNHLEIFKLIQMSRSYLEICNILDMKEFYDKFIINSEEAKKFGKYFDGSYYKDKFKNIMNMAKIENDKNKTANDEFKDEK